MPPLGWKRLSTLGFFLLVFLALPLPVAGVAAVTSALPVAGAGLGRRQRVHAQNLVDLTESQQPQSVLEPETTGRRNVDSQRFLLDDCTGI